MQAVVSASAALKDDTPAAEPLKDGLDYFKIERLAAGGHDPGLFQCVVSVELLEQPERPGEVVHYLQARLVVVAIAGGRQRVDAGRVLVVLMSPEVLVRAAGREEDMSVRSIEIPPWYRVVM